LTIRKVILFPTLPRRDPLMLHGVALVFYALFSLLLLYALLFQNGTHTAGYDFFNYNWNFWWIRHALQTPGLNLYENNFVMFPALSNYGYHVLAIVWYPLWAVLQPLFADPISGTLTAINIMIFSACALNGYLMFAFLRAEGVVPLWALIGGAALQALPIVRYFYFNTHLNLMTWFWLPGLLLLWKRIAARAATGRGIAALVWGAIFGVALWALLLTDLQFPIFAAFLLAPYGLRSVWRIWKTGDLASRWRHISILAAAGVLSLIVGVALIAAASPLPSVLRFEGELAPGAVEDRPGIPLSGFVTMAAEWWSWGDPSVGAFVTVAVVAALALNRSRRAQKRDARWFWFVVMLPPLILALGPTLRVFGTDIPLPPFRWLHALTNGMFRMPWRLAPIAVIAGMAFAGLTFTASMRERDQARVRQARSLQARVWGGAAALLALGMAVRLFESAPMAAVPPRYAFYEEIGRETGDFVVVEVPNAVGTGEVLIGDPAAIQYQWYGITHGKRMINGFISRAPVEDFWYMVTDDPMLSWLGQRRFLDPEAVERQLRERIFADPIGYIVVHLDRIGLQASTAQEIVGYFNQLDDLLCPAFIEGAVVVYRTAGHPSGCGDSPRTPPEIAPNVYRVDIGGTDDWRYLGWGWHWREPVAGIDWRWTGATTTLQDRIDADPARLYLDLPPGAYTLTLTAQAFWEARRLRVWANGAELGAADVATDMLQSLSFALPTEIVGAGRQIELRLETDAAIIPADVGQSADPRPLGIAVDTMTFERAL